MKYIEVVEKIRDMKTDVEFNEIINDLSVEQIFRLEKDKHIKEKLKEITKEEFKKIRKDKFNDLNHLYISKNFNLSAEKSGTYYYKRTYTLN